MHEESVAIIVERGFVPTELALVQDILRIASRLSDVLRFSTKIYTSSAPGLVEGMGGMMVRADQLNADMSDLPRYIVVLGGSDLKDTFTDIRVRLRWFERRGCTIILLSDAALEWRKLFQGSDGFVTHWENQQLLVDAGDVERENLPLYSQKGRIITAAGMIATADVILKKIVAEKSPNLAQATSLVLLVDRIRDGDAYQRHSGNNNVVLQLAGLDAVIAGMEQNLDCPLSASELAALSGRSIRQLERRFRLVVGQSPMAFYRSLRLRRSKTMLEQTSLPITEVSCSCGFGTPSTFSKLFLREFNITPTKLRNQMVASKSPSARPRKI